MNEKDLIDFITRERKKQKLNRNNLANLSGIHRATISRIESGYIESCRLTILIKILNALGYKLTIEKIDKVETTYENDGLRDKLINEIENVFGSCSNFLDFIEDEKYNFDSFDCFVRSDDENYVIDRRTGEYINWYKFTHIGRCLHMRCDDIAEFLIRFKNSEIKGEC